MKLVEFLYFYLMPEAPPSSASSSISSGYSGDGGSRQLQKSPSKRLGSSFGGRSVSGVGGDGEAARTTEEKQRLLGRYLSSVEDLVEDLRESAPFGTNWGR